MGINRGRAGKIEKDQKNSKKVLTFEKLSDIIIKLSRERREKRKMKQKKLAKNLKKFLTNGCGFRIIAMFRRKGVYLVN